MGKVKETSAGEAAAEKPPTIVLEPWNTNTPYLKELQRSFNDKAYETCLVQRMKYGNSPAFFLDCADFFFNKKEYTIALRILSNIAEMELENARLLRVLGYRLEQLGKLELSAAVFEEVLRLRPEEPQSWRDLALVLASLKQYERAIELLKHVVMNEWDRFDEIELVALMELNDTIEKAKSAGFSDFAIMPQFIKPLDVDLRIVLTWDADTTDIDLWVIEPTGEKVYYSNHISAMGGIISRDFRDGYRPEEYLIKKAQKGTYTIQANYFGTTSQELTGPVTVRADIFNNYGRPNAEHHSLTFRLSAKEDTVTLGHISLPK